MDEIRSVRKFDKCSIFLLTIPGTPPLGRAFYFIFVHIS